MFVVLLKIQAEKTQLAAHMPAHKAWLQQGFDDGCFVLAGNITSQAGGAILVHGISEEELACRLQEDPFVREALVSIETIAIQAAKSDPRLAFLCAN